MHAWGISLSFKRTHLTLSWIHQLYTISFFVSRTLIAWRQALLQKKYQEGLSLEIKNHIGNRLTCYVYLTATISNFITRLWWKGDGWLGDKNSYQGKNEREVIFPWFGLWVTCNLLSFGRNICCKLQNQNLCSWDIIAYMKIWDLAV